MRWDNEDDAAAAYAESEGAKAQAQAEYENAEAEAMSGEGAMQEKLTVDILAQLIRMANPDHDAGAGEIAEKILPWILARLAASEPAPQPQDAPICNDCGKAVLECICESR